MIKILLIFAIFFTDQLFAMQKESALADFRERKVQAATETARLLVPMARLLPATQDAAIKTLTVKPQFTADHDPLACTKLPPALYGIIKGYLFHPLDAYALLPAYSSTTFKKNKKLLEKYKQIQCNIIPLDQASNGQCIVLYKESSEYKQEERVFIDTRERILSIKKTDVIEQITQAYLLPSGIIILICINGYVEFWNQHTQEQIRVIKHTGYNLYMLAHANENKLVFIGKYFPDGIAIEIDVKAQELCSKLALPTLLAFRELVVAMETLHDLPLRVAQYELKNKNAKMLQLFVEFVDHYNIPLILQQYLANYYYLAMGPEILNELQSMNAQEMARFKTVITSIQTRPDCYREENKKTIKFKEISSLYKKLSPVLQKYLTAYFHDTKLEPQSTCVIQ